MIKNGDKIYRATKTDLKKYTYETYKSEPEQKKDAKNAPKPLTEEKKQEIVTKMLAAAARPNGANRPYGTGETIHSAGVAVSRTGEVRVEGQNGYFVGETVFLEARARTYATKTGVGAETQTSLMRAEYGGKASVSLINVGETEVVGAGAYGRGEFFVGTQTNVHAGAGMKGILPYAAASAAGFAGARAVIGAGGELRFLGIGARVDGSAYAWAGAQGSAGVSVTPTGVKAGVEGFAGASAGATGTASIGGIGVTGEANAYAGVGGQAGVAFGLTEDGDITVSAELGGALGLGAGAGVSVSIDTDQVIADTEAFLKAAGELADDAGQAAGDVAEDLGNAAGDVVEAVGDTAEAAGEALGDVAEDAGETAGGVIDAVGDFLGF